MINFYEIDIKRIAVHLINPKKESAEHAGVATYPNLTIINQNVENLIKERLSMAASKSSKAFELEIDDYSSGSFFDIAKEIKSADDNVFIDRSIEAAEHLASAMTRNNLPGGYFIFIEAETIRNQHVVIAIKAEWHTVLKLEPESDKSKLQVLDDVFLSQSQKFYKIGIIFEKDEEEPEKEPPNNMYGGFIYDDQFKPDSKPAEYFFKDFLGFTTITNSRIQSKRFYDSTENFIKSNVPGSDEKDELLSVLKHEFMTNDEPEITPNDFASLYFNDDDLRDNYTNQVVPNLPKQIVKDPSMIESKLKKKKLDFPNKVNISGPSNIFDYNVKVIKSKNEMQDLDPENEDITLIKVIGKPYQDK